MFVGVAAFLVCRSAPTLHCQLLLLLLLLLLLFLFLLLFVELSERRQASKSAA